MTIDLKERIRQAVTEGQKIRSAYYGAIDLPDEQELGSPASEDELKELEAHFGKSLPQSYRVFLQLYDGWRMVDGAMDLLSVQEMLDSSHQKRVKEWKLKVLEEDDFVAVNSLVIGVSRVTPTRLLLDPTRVDSEGEWAVVQHYHEEECVYPSFLAWLEESVDEFRELLNEEKDINNYQ